MLTALENWVEKGEPPNRIVASLVEYDVVTRTRPLCPYPEVAVYSGSGSTDDEANFVCRAPRAQDAEGLSAPAPTAQRKVPALSVPAPIASVLPIASAPIVTPLRAPAFASAPSPTAASSNAPVPSARSPTAESSNAPVPSVPSPTAASSNAPAFPSAPSPTAASSNAPVPSARSPTAESSNASVPSARSPAAESLNAPAFPSAPSPTAESSNAPVPSARSPTAESSNASVPSARSPAAESLNAPAFPSALSPTAESSNAPVPSAPKSQTPPAGPSTASVNGAPIWMPATTIEFVEGVPAVVSMLNFVRDPDSDPLVITLKSGELLPGISWNPMNYTIAYDGRPMGAKADAPILTEVIFSADDGRPSPSSNAPAFPSAPSPTAESSNAPVPSAPKSQTPPAGPSTASVNGAPIWMPATTIEFVEGVPAVVSMLNFVRDPDSDPLVITLKSGELLPGFTWNPMNYTIAYDGRPMGAKADAPILTEAIFSADDGRR